MPNNLFNLSSKTVIFQAKVCFFDFRQISIYSDQDFVKSSLIWNTNPPQKNWKIQKSQKRKKQDIFEISMAFDKDLSCREILRNEGGVEFKVSEIFAKSLSE